MLMRVNFPDLFGCFAEAVALSLARSGMLCSSAALPTWECT
jgi:hypothetical protein